MKLKVVVPPVSGEPEKTCPKCGWTAPTLERLRGHMESVQCPSNNEFSELKEPSTESAPERPMERHVGLHHGRLDPQADNPREVSFAEQWREENQYGQLMYLIPALTPRDEQVAATVIQWLGSNVGLSFLRAVVKRDARVRDWLES